MGAAYYFLMVSVFALRLKNSCSLAPPAYTSLLYGSIVWSYLLSTQEVY